MRVLWSEEEAPSLISFLKIRRSDSYRLLLYIMDNGSSQEVSSSAEKDLSVFS
jgi:hypothetical protein